MTADTANSKWNALVAGLVFVSILICYLITISPTVSFWDSGEFIATSYILGIPHPPGTPFYVIIGRLFTFLPFEEKALGINLMSALTGALAALFLYLTTVRILVFWRGEPSSARERLIVYVSSACAAIAGAFSSSFWTNSIEAEVYSPSAFIMAFTVWLIVRWARRSDEPGSRNSLVLICYLLALSVGLHLGTGLVFPAFVLFALIVDWKIFTDVRMIMLILVVSLIGLSNHLYLPIRSALNPSIDEANPEKWQAFKDCLLRKQYKPMNPFIRQASWSFQFGMFWRYFKEQWTGLGGRWTVLLIPIGAFGSIVHYFKERRTFVLIGTIFLMTTLWLIIYMNFTDHEVRERDYFFAHGFFFFSIWIAIAFAYLLDYVSSRAGEKNYKVIGVAVLLLAFTASSYYVNFESHDRRGNYNAYDYAYNLLSTVDKDGILFTNGDNDTFPLWFMQEVKGYRKDVRVVNLSLLNTPWYIWQLKHLEPKVPMRFSDKDIERLRPYRDESGRIVMVKDIAAREIINANQWKKPIYFAVTVADYIGYDPQLKLEGLAFRLMPEKGNQMIDVERTLYNLYCVYRYRGLLKPVNAEQPLPTDLEYKEFPGFFDREALNIKYVYDTEVYKDENTKRLVTNYAAAHLRLCIYYLQNHKYEDAVRELERASLISPTYGGFKDLAILTYGFAGRVAKAESLGNYFLAMDPTDVNIYIQLFRVYRRIGDEAKAEEILIRMVNALPNNPDAYTLLSSFYEEKGEYAKAAAVVRKWLNLHPRDRAAERVLRDARQRKGREESEIMQKLIIIGLDGGTFDILEPLIRRGDLPFIGELASSGVRGLLKTVIPPGTGPAWASIVTGLDPSNHGIFDIITRDKDSYNLAFLDGSSLRAPAIWDHVGRNGGQVILLNIPMTYPPRSVNGYLVSGLLTPPRARHYTYPPELSDEIVGLVPSYRIVPSMVYRPGRGLEFVDDLLNLLEYKRRILLELISRIDWTFAMQVFNETDFLQHALWHVIDQSHPRFNSKEGARLRDRFFDVYRKIDSIVGEVLNRIDEETSILIVSDHGAGPLHHFFHANNFFLQRGILALRRSPVSQFKYLMFRSGYTPLRVYKLMTILGQGKARLGLRWTAKGYDLMRKMFFSFADIDWRRSIAYAISGGVYGAVYINLKGREPEGIVDSSEYERVRDRLANELLTIEDPVYGGKLIEKVLRREEVYRGRFISEAPDLYFLPRRPTVAVFGDFEFSSNRTIENASRAISCQHRMEGIFIGKGSLLRSGAEVRSLAVIDITPLALYLMDLEIPDCLDGKLPIEVLDSAALEHSKPRYVEMKEFYERTLGERSTVTDEDIKERLKGLGYIS